MRELEIHRVQRERVESAELARTQTFDTALDTIQSNIDSFGSLTAFDWLEFVVRLYGHEWLCPTTLKPKYIHTGDGPYEGLRRLFGDEAEESTDTCLERLERYARDHREVSNTELIFGLESALCMFSPSHLSEEKFRKLTENGESQEGILSHHC